MLNIAATLKSLAAILILLLHVFSASGLRFVISLPGIRPKGMTLAPVYSNNDNAQPVDRKFKLDNTRFDDGGENIFPGKQLPIYHSFQLIVFIQAAKVGLLPINDLNRKSSPGKQGTGLLLTSVAGRYLKQPVLLLFSPEQAKTIYTIPADIFSKTVYYKQTLEQPPC